MTLPTPIERHYSTGAALGMVLVPSTTLGILHLVHEVSLGDRSAPTVVTLVGSVLAFTLGATLWSGLLTRLPRRAPATDR